MCSASSVRTVRGSRRCCASSPGWTGPTAVTCGSPPGPPATCRRSPTAPGASGCTPTSRGAPASPTPTRVCSPPRATWRRTHPVRRTVTPARSRRGSRSAAPIWSSARRPSCVTSGWIPALLDLETATLSGGEAARASLAAILLSRFDVLLLDEPTNDLDFDGLARLERFVAERPGGAVIVSHDRAFLERTVTRILELDEIAHTASEYGGGWAGYLELRATAARHAEERYEAYGTSARPARRSRPPPAPVVGDRRAPGQGLRRYRPRQDRPLQASRALREAGSEGPLDGEGDRAARSGGEAVAALGAAAALRRRRALGRRDRAPRPRDAAARQLHARPARPRAGLGRAGRARRRRTAAARRRWSTG